ncbi:hypothetical protein HG536_0G00470 [Torulaspora globosa]|uniref:UBX domain-containing protein n=1 Tax=Torulaspora globosa TaxID=48254 RepID=A0A7G3ZL04_9SACH|nr:uncharacterized protein HG536_0G00470 [Torulaspora globosa]QLL34190.1 hypothetical protein HG536_0G00470 [Torulaspora globosa]
MATVSVNYKFSSFRVKVTPNTVMNDVLSESLSHFRLIESESSKPKTQWILEHDKKPVTLDLPWRFLNLSPGVKLELKEGDPTVTANKIASVRIKLQVMGHPTVIETIRSTADLRDVLDILASKHGWSINLLESKLQVVSKTIPYAELRGLHLADLGVKDSVLLRLITKAPSEPTQLPPTDKQSTAEENVDDRTPVPETEENVDDRTPVLDTEEPAGKKQSLHKVSAFVPPETSITSKVHNEVENDDDYEMTVDEARAYQKMLSKQRGNLGGPLLSKRLRQAREEVHKRAVTECVVRIRFPDLNHIEVTFRPDENMDTVYKVVSESILPEHSEFTLSQPHPYITYPRDERKLVDDLAFGSKTLLVFKSDKEGPYLSNAVLEQAKQLGEADDIRLDQINHRADTNGVGLKTKTKSKPSWQASKMENVPKWLRLNKK